MSVRSSSTEVLVNGTGGNGPARINIGHSLATGVWLVTPHSEDDFTYLVVLGVKSPEDAARHLARLLKNEAPYLDLPKRWQVHPLRNSDPIFLDEDSSDIVIDSFVDEWIEVRL